MKKRLCNFKSQLVGNKYNPNFNDRRDFLISPSRNKISLTPTQRLHKFPSNGIIPHSRNMAASDKMFALYNKWAETLLRMRSNLENIKFFENICTVGEYEWEKIKNMTNLRNSLRLSSFYTSSITTKNRLNIATVPTQKSKPDPFLLQQVACIATNNRRMDYQRPETYLAKNHENIPILGRRLSNLCYLPHFLLDRLAYIKRMYIRAMALLRSNLVHHTHSLPWTTCEALQYKTLGVYNLLTRRIFQTFTLQASKLRFIRYVFRKRALETFFCCLLFSSFEGAEGAKLSGFGCKSVTAGQACLGKEYSKYELPNKKGVNPIEVELLIQEVLRINDKDYSITFSCYYNIKWPDPRLTLKPEFGYEIAKPLLEKDPNFNITMNPNVAVPMNLEMIKDLWLPNVLIYNLKTFKVMDVLSKLAGLWISADYKILYSTATHITFICPMHFDKFPLDRQRCKFQIGSYSYDDSQMTFKTTAAKYDGKEYNSIALDYAIEIKPLSQEDSILQFDGLGNFSLAGFELVLDRYVSTYIITYYLPSGLFVIVSWISFLIPMDVIPGRMALLVTLFLVLVNIFNNVTTNTPKAEGLTAIEAWMLACILFVFGALIE